MGWKIPSGIVWLQIQPVREGIKKFGSLPPCQLLLPRLRRAAGPLPCLRHALTTCAAAPPAPATCAAAPPALATCAVAAVHLAPPLLLTAGEGRVDGEGRGGMQEEGRGIEGSREAGDREWEEEE